MYKRGLLPIHPCLETKSAYGGFAGNSTRCENAANGNPSSIRPFIIPENPSPCVHSNHHTH